MAVASCFRIAVSDVVSKIVLSDNFTREFGMVGIGAVVQDGDGDIVAALSNVPGIGHFGCF